MGLLVDSTSLVEPSITSLGSVETGLWNGDKTINNFDQMPSDSTDLLVDNQTGQEQTDEVGQYTSLPRTLTLETSSQKILASISTGGSGSGSSTGGSDETHDNSGSLENIGAPVNMKLCTLFGSFIAVSFVVGTL